MSSIEHERLMMAVDTSGLQGTWQRDISFDHNNDSLPCG
jgi:hypothetical protein